MFPVSLGTSIPAEYNQSRSMPESFWSNLSRSNLLTSRQLDSVREQFTEPDRQSQAVAGWLVEQGSLTAWQVEMLLAGHSRFFLGRYRLMELLGQGGMGAVFHAEQAPLGRSVAIKVLARQLIEDEDAVARFRREIEAAAALVHPNIVTAYDADCVGGSHFLVMDFVEGHDLASLLSRRGTLSVGEGCEYVRQAAVGLQHAFEQNMVHRDIKPGNLLVHQTDGKRPVVKILDMGLARFTSETAEAGGDLTQAGQVMGTPDYIAPEQSIDTHSADIRADIFSLGCTLFRLLTGQLPWPDGSAVRKLLARRTTDAPPIRTLRPDIPQGLETVIARMLARQPDDRYQTPSEVARALTPYAIADLDNATVPNIRAAEFTPSVAETKLLASEMVETDAITSNFLQSLASEATLASTSEAMSGRASALPEVGVETVATQRGGLSAQMERRKQAERTRLWMVAGVTLLLIAVFGGWTLWSAGRQPQVVIEWDQAERKNAGLQVDGQARPLPEAGPLVLTEDSGKRVIVMTRPGYMPVTETVTLESGGSIVLRPDWRPTPETTRRSALERLQHQVTETRSSTSGTSKLFEQLDAVGAFRAEFAGTAEARTAAGLFRDLAAYADSLQQLEIDPYELRIATGTAFGSDVSAPSELVAIIGDSRLRHSGHTMWPTFTPDGSMLVTAGRDRKNLHCWDPESGKLIRTVSRNADVHGLAFSANGRFAIGSHELLIFKGLDGELLQTIDAGSAHIRLKFDSSGRTIAFHTHDGLRIADVESGEITREESAWQVAFNPLGDEIAFVHEDGGRIEDGASGDVICSFEFPHSNGTDVSWSPDGKLLAVTGTHLDGTLLFEAGTGEQVRSIPWAPGSVVKFHPDSTLFAIRDPSGGCGLHSVADGEMVHRWSGGIVSMEFSPDGETLATGTWHDSVQLRNARTGQIRLDQAPMITSVDVSPDGRFIATGHVDGSIQLVDLADEAPINQQATHAPAPFQHGQATWAVQFSPAGYWPSRSSQSDSPRDTASGHVLASAGADFLVGVQNINRGSHITYSGHGNTHVSAVGWSAGGRTMASAGNDEMIAIRDTLTGKKTNSVSMGHDHVRTLAMQPGGRLVAIADREGRVSVWDTQSKQQANTEAGFAVAFSPDGNRYAIGEEDGTVSLWDASNHRTAAFVVKHPQSVRAVAFSDDGKSFASASSDGMIRIALIDGDTVKRSNDEVQLSSFVGNIRQLIFTPDARHLVTANQNGTAFVLRLSD